VFIPGGGNRFETGGLEALARTCLQQRLQLRGVADLYVHALRGSKRDSVRDERFTRRAVNAYYPHWQFVR